MRNVSCIAVALIASILMSSSIARAEESGEPWSASCRAFHSSRHFASQATAYCLRQPDQRECHGRAERFFERCRFAGDYRKISARIEARMLLVIALGSFRSVHHLDL